MERIQQLRRQAQQTPAETPQAVDELRWPTQSFLEVHYPRQSAAMLKQATGQAQAAEVPAPEERVPAAPATPPAPPRRDTRRAALRRALVLSEILGTPRALRDEGPRW